MIGSVILGVPDLGSPRHQPNDVRVLGELLFAR